jgi:lysophospholipase L1-like esterase
VVPDLTPKVVTIYIGWNDLMKFDPLGQAGSRWAGVARFIDRFWLVKGLRKLIFFYLRPELRPAATGPESRTGRFADFAPRFYESNLREIVAEVRSLGARPLLLTLPTVVRMEMTADDMREAGVVFPYFPSAYAVGDFLDILGAYNRTIWRVADDEQVPVVDLARHFAELPDVRPYFYDTMHTNAEGMAIIARALEAGLERASLLGLSIPADSLSGR